ncbi:sigma-70 family RNA polymerase sigma factor [Plastoroseomonas arctica]|uniref:Sigma-70 family RNA polymerase sigma factor n=1 Tax=Plastoroseomonas arctica TaxID=1509237 RepID=A0AAF1K1W4_9PROT|nr:sigma-70 family RNA polymerase sigma factor [Plastoroseomonas arctica]MBR0655353.1 sigma-70 family RNA polymerase sigma factor [Plastoroseomonas arctica]
MEHDSEILPRSPDAQATEPEFSFHNALVAALPRLRVQALSLTRNRADADDLVQAAVTNALSAQGSFTPGTNFQAWMFRILRNRFLSDRRRNRDTIEIDEAPPASVARPAGQEHSLALAELRCQMARLPADQRTALVMVSLQGMSYEDVAEAMGCAVGTAKCRVFRARRQLEIWMLGEGEGRRSPARARNAGVSQAQRGRTSGDRHATVAEDSQPRM